MNGCHWQKHFLVQEEKTLRQALFGPLKPVSWEEYQKIYNQTGLDVDGRKKAFMECLTDVNHYEKINEIYVNFFKDIPGFRDLPFHDQVSLIRGKTVCPSLSKPRKSGLVCGSTSASFVVVVVFILPTREPSPPAPHHFPTALSAHPGQVTFTPPAPICTAHEPLGLYAD